MVKLTTNYLLFDLDGTLVNSTPAVEQTWHDVVEKHNKTYPANIIDPVEFLASAHGARTVESFLKHFPYRRNTPEEINDFEFGIVANYGHLAKAVDGVPVLLKILNDDFQNSWAIVTSGTKKLAHGWFEMLFKCYLKPPVFITANDVSNGKPDPEGYLAAFEQLNEKNATELQSTTAIVFEDAPTGIKAGVQGGFTVVGLATTFGKDVLTAAGASYVISDMSKLKLNRVNDSVQVELDIL